MTRDLRPDENLEAVPHLALWLAGRLEPPLPPVPAVRRERPRAALLKVSYAPVLRSVPTEWQSSSAIAALTGLHRERARQIMNACVKRGTVERLTLPATGDFRRDRVVYRRLVRNTP